MGRGAVHGARGCAWEAGMRSAQGEGVCVGANCPETNLDDESTPEVPPNTFGTQVVHLTHHVTTSAGGPQWPKLAYRFQSHVPFFV